MKRRRGGNRKKEEKDREKVNKLRIILLCCYLTASFTSLIVLGAESKAIEIKSDTNT